MERKRPKTGEGNSTMERQKGNSRSFKKMDQGKTSRLNRSGKGSKTPFRKRNVYNAIGREGEEGKGVEELIYTREGKSKRRRHTAG